MYAVHRFLLVSIQVCVAFRKGLTQALPTCTQAVFTCTVYACTSASRCVRVTSATLGTIIIVVHLCIRTRCVLFLRKGDTSSDTPGIHKCNTGSIF